MHPGIELLKNPDNPQISLSDLCSKDFSLWLVLEIVLKTFLCIFTILSVPSS